MSLTVVLTGPVAGALLHRGQLCLHAAPGECSRAAPRWRRGGLGVAVGVVGLPLLLLLPCHR